MHIFVIILNTVTFYPISATAKINRKSFFIIYDEEEKVFLFLHVEKNLYFSGLLTQKH